MAGRPESLLDNIMILSDSYKTSHWRQYPPGTTTVYSYFESRGGKFPEVTFFGLQYIIKRYLTGQVPLRSCSRPCPRRRWRAVSGEPPHRRCAAHRW